MLFIRPSILRRTTDIDYYSRKKYSIVQQGLVDAANSVGGKGNPLMRPYDELLNDNPPPPLSETPSTAQPVLPPMAPAKDVDDEQVDAQAKVDHTMGRAHVCTAVTNATLD